MEEILVNLIVLVQIIRKLHVDKRYGRQIVEGATTETMVMTRIRPRDSRSPHYNGVVSVPSVGQSERKIC